MDNIILYLLNIIQLQQKQICWLFLLISKYMPLKQWAFDDSRSPKYEKIKVDKLPVIIKFEKQDYRCLLDYYKWKYRKRLKPIKSRNGKVSTVSTDAVCPKCSAPHDYLYDNNGGKVQFQCKVCGQTFIIGEQVTSPVSLRCSYCGHSLIVSLMVSVQKMVFSMVFPFGQLTVTFFDHIYTPTGSY